LTAGVGTVLATAAAVFGPAAPALAAAPTAAPAQPGRVLIISLPILGWGDLPATGAPNLTKLLRSSAVADMSTRSANGSAQLGDGYATISAGTRAATNHSNDGDALETREKFGDSTAAEVFARRTGVNASHGIVHLGIADVVDQNTGLLFDAKIGELGDTLASAGYSRAVIANADGSEPDSPISPSRYHRTAVTALMSADGTLPEGAVGPELLRKDPGAPFGVKLDVPAVDRAFRRVWKDKSVVLVEASDLVRADSYATFETSAQRSVQRRNAVDRTDALVGSLLSHVNLARDAVIVVGPAKPSSGSSLTIGAVHAPGYTPGLLKSGTTRRAGFVSLVDIGPTVLQVLGVSRPEAMEGRPMKLAGDGGSYADRVSYMVHANADGLFRDHLVTVATNAVVACTIVFVVGAAILLALRRWRVALQWAALVLVGFPLATFFASRIHFTDHGGTTAYWAFVGVVAVVFAALCRLLGRRGPLDPLIVALAGVAVVHIGDVLTGTHLEFNSVFGFSPTVGIRFSGLGNFGSAQLTGSVAILAGLLAWRIGGRRGIQVAIAVMAVTLVMIAAPIWGQDFGGTLATAPAFALLAWILLGKRVTVKTVLALVGILVAGGLLVGFIDLLRPADQRTHVGRFFEKVGNEGWSGFVTVLHRKGNENVDTLGSTGWILLIFAVIALALFLWFRAPNGLRRAFEHIPTLRASAVGFLVAAARGYALNDSGVVVPGIMLSIAAATIIYLTIAATTPGSLGPVEPALEGPAADEPALGGSAAAGTRALGGP
jgi:hypothetical protein